MCFVFLLEFPTTQLEMEKVADIFDKDRDGYIDYKEFVAALKPAPDSGVRHIAGNLNCNYFFFTPFSFLESSCGRC